MIYWRESSYGSYQISVLDCATWSGFFRAWPSRARKIGHMLCIELTEDSCTNVQHHLSTYINDALLGNSEFTVWDRPWAPNEEARGSCCTANPDRNELGRLRYPGEPLNERAKKNPIAQMEAAGGGIFELHWSERARLLRQLVDWQRKWSY